ncbi:MAG: zinc ribbon domain-containing protein, partial [Terriglobia bacterium]
SDMVACPKQMPAVFCLVMSVPRCSACGAELLPEANFCRQCGVTVTSGSAVITSEEPTRNLNERVEGVATQRLDPRATSPGPGSLKNSIANSVAAASLGGHAPPARRRIPVALLVGGVVLVIIIAIISSVAFVRMRSHSRTTDNAALIYPGAQTVVDMTSDEGRAIQLQTADSLDRVLAWYEGSLKPTKTMRLTSTSFVLRNRNVTATIATEDNKTNILIKQSLTP